MKTTRALVAAAAVLAIGACSSEDVAEKLVEDQLESQGNGDVDIDLDDGNFSIETPEGEIQFNTDSEGNVSIEGVGEDGEEFSIQADEEGNVQFEGGEGEGSMQIDSEDGQTVIQSDEGTAVISSGGTDLPEGFPELPLPDGFVIDFTQSIESPDGTTYSVVGNAPGDFQDYVDQLVAFLESAGYTQMQLTTTPEGSFLGYTDGTQFVTASASESGTPGEFTASYTVTPDTSG